MSTKTKVLTAEMLKELQPEAMIIRGPVGCIEECTTPGIYILSAGSSTTQTPPSANWNYGLMEVMDRYGDVVQRITHVDGYAVYQRVRRNGVWKGWYYFNLTPIPT